MTTTQRERLKESFDVLRSVFAEIRDERGNGYATRRLDVILNKLEKLIYATEEKIK